MLVIHIQAALPNTNSSTLHIYRLEPPPPLPFSLHPIRTRYLPRRDKRLFAKLGWSMRHLFEFRSIYRYRAQFPIAFALCERFFEFAAIMIAKSICDFIRSDCTCSRSSASSVETDEWGEGGDVRSKYSKTAQYSCCSHLFSVCCECNCTTSFQFSWFSLLFRVSISILLVRLLSS